MAKISPPHFLTLIQLISFYHSHPGLDPTKEQVCTVRPRPRGSLFSKCMQATVCPFSRNETHATYTSFWALFSELTCYTHTMISFTGFIPVVLQRSSLVGFPGGASGKEPTCQCRLDVRDSGSISGPGRSPGGVHGHPLQYSCLGNPMDKEVSWVTVCRVAKSRTRLKRLSTHNV